MAKTLAVLIFITFITCGISLVFSVVALGTDQWIVATVDLNTASISTINNEVNYGLFSGSYIRTVSTRVNYGLSITCDFGENKCAMLCGDFDLRRTYLQRLLQGDTSDGYRSCSESFAQTSRRKIFEKSIDSQTRADTAPDGFINSGAWLSTVIFLSLSCLFGVISTVLAIWNTVSNPVDTFLSVLGLFAYQCVACILSFLALIIWGVHFGVSLSHSVGIHDTITTSGNSEDQASLGYSYWFILISFLGYGSSAGILVCRHFLINKEPDTIVNLEDKNDNTIILF